MRPIVFLFLALAFTSPAVAQVGPTSAKPATVKSPLSPEESLKHFVLADKNLQIEIVAAEPEVIDPVAIQFDEHGRLWVAELSDYPNGPEPGKPPMSRIKLLEDKDGDGRYETAHIFADKLLFATGVQPWDGGVIVTLAGEVAYFKDTDGDHKADVRETWFTGFAQANPQLRANHPTFGPDGWIYVANGLRGGNVIAVKKDWPSRLGTPVRPSGESNGKESGKSAQPTEPQPVSLTGRDFKFDPLTGRYEAISGNGQFGLTFDAWGNRFVCDNRHPCRHVIFEEDFIKRCPHVAFPAVIHDVIPADDKNQVFPLTSAWTTSNLHAGTFTAACGLTVYTGDWLPEEFRGNVFVCEPTGNLVQRAILEPDGVTFKSRNPYQRSPVAPRQEKPNAPSTPANKSTPNGQSGSTARSADLSRSDRATGTQEFLASGDDWFRPVDLQNGPDGALYVVDMYRAVIEHPEWVPDELKKRPDTWLGNDNGRIYRIRPKGERPKREPTVSVANLDASFNSTNGWQRSASLRIAFEQASHNLPIPKTVPVTPEARCLALRTSSSLGWCTANTTLRSVIDQNEFVRAEAARVAVQAWLEPNNDREFYHARNFLTELLADENPRVRFNAVQGIRLRFGDDHAHAALLARLGGFKDAADRWTHLAIAGTFQVPPSLVLDCLLFDHDLHPTWLSPDKTEERLKWAAGRSAFIAMTCDQIAVHATIAIKNGKQEDAELLIENVVDFIASFPFRDKKVLPRTFDESASALLAFSNALARQGRPFAWKRNSKFNKAPIAVEKLVSHAQEVIQSQSNHESSDLILMTRVLQLGDFEKVAKTLRVVAETSTDQALKHSAVESFASFQKPDVDAWLVERYRSETPAIRRAILAALFASKERQLRLLEAIEQGQIAATELDPVRVNQLTQAKDETLRERAKTVLAAAAPASRHEVLDAYRPALALSADPKRGREVFVKNCSTCHRVDNVGVNVAPDISDTRTKKPEQLLLDILDPNKAIDANYFAYAVVTKDGKVESGVISAETATSITLKQPEGKVLTLLRTDIDELRNTGLSLMPVGVEKNIDQQAMADLIFWLKNWRYLDGKVPATSLGEK